MCSVVPIEYVKLIITHDWSDFSGNQPSVSCDFTVLCRTCAGFRQVSSKVGAQIWGWSGFVKIPV